MLGGKVGYMVVNQQTVAGETARYAGRNASSIPDMSQLRTALRQTILAQRLEGIGIDNSRTKELTFIPLDFSTERITERGRGGSGMASVLFGFAIGFLLYMTIIIYGQTIMSSVIEEKTSRVAEVVMSSVPTDTLLAGKVLGVGAVGLTQQILWVATTYVLLKLRAPIMERLGAPAMSFGLPEISLGAAILFLLFFVLGFIFYSALYAAVGSAVNSEQEARQAATPLMIMIVFAGVFIQPVLLNPTGTIAQVLSLRADHIADHHADTHGGDGSAAAGDDREHRLPGNRLLRGALGGGTHLPGGIAHVRKETDDAGDGAVGFFFEIAPGCSQPSIERAPG